MQKEGSIMKESVKKLEALMEIGGIKKDICFLVISGIALIISIFKLIPLPFDAAWVAIILCGIPIIMEAVIGLITEFDIKADVLVSLALIASVFIDEDFAAGEVAFIMQLGALLEELTVAKARAGIEKLVRLTPQTARLVKDGTETIVAATDVAVDDILRVLPGETIPVDGVDKTVGDEVSSGTVNQFGTFEMKATKVGEDSSIQRMIRLVQSADAGKAKIVGLADRFATWIVVIALSAAALTWLFTGQIIRAVTILVVFCPCALVLATPTAIMAAIGNATKHGFLVREGDALEKLAKVSKITFDKTGTLTCGTPKVVTAYSAHPGYSSEDIYRFCAGAEQHSEHPLGKAVLGCFKQEYGAVPAVDDFHMIPGRGVSASVEGKMILAGNMEMMAENRISFNQDITEKAEGFLAQGCTVIYVAFDGILAGFLALSDTVRVESASMISRLHSLNVEPVLLTGDHENAAASIAMGGVGSDIAVDAADIALVDDEVKEIPHLVALSKRMMTTIKVNMTFSMALNFLAITLAITGKLNPVVGALVHNAGSVLVITNSALLLKWKLK